MGGGRKRKWKLKQDAKLTRIRIGQGKRKPREGMIPLTRILMNYLRKNLRREMILNHPKLKRNPLIQRARMIGRRNPERGAGRTVKMRMIVKRRRYNLQKRSTPSAKRNLKVKRKVPRRKHEKTLKRLLIQSLKVRKRKLVRRKRKRRKSLLLMNQIVRRKDLKRNIKRKKHKKHKKNKKHRKHKKRKNDSSSDEDGSDDEEEKESSSDESD